MRYGKVKRISTAVIIAIFAVLICTATIFSLTTPVVASAQIATSNPSSSREINVTTNNSSGYDDSEYQDLYGISKSNSYYYSYTGTSVDDETYTSGKPYVVLDPSSSAYSTTLGSSSAGFGGFIYNAENAYYTTDYSCLALSSNPDASTTVSATFKLGDELRKVLKDKMLVVQVTPYVVTSGNANVISSLGDVDNAHERATLTAFMYNGTEDGEGSNAITKLSTKTISLPVSYQMSTGNSSTIASREYEENSFLQVTLSNFVQNGSYAMAIREIGIKITVTFSSAISMRTQSGSPSNDPDQINKVTTCLVLGDDRHADAPATYAKVNDILDINLVLQKDGAVLTLDTSAYTAETPSIENCSDGTMFRRLFLTEDDEYLVTWEVVSGAVDQDATQIDDTNKSGQSIKYQVAAGDPDTGNLTLVPSISYYDLITGEVKPIKETSNRLEITVYIDNNAPKTPSLNQSATYYEKYVDEDTATYYTTVQSSFNDDDRDAEENVLRLSVTGSNNATRPVFNDSSLDKEDGSNYIIYYKTSYIGDEIPATIAEKKAVSFLGPIFTKTKIILDESAGTFTYAFNAYEGRMVRSEDYYHLIKKDTVAGNVIPTDDDGIATYYVRNNYGEYRPADHTITQKGVSYYEAERYDYEQNGEFTGVYATVDNSGCTYNSIYTNMYVYNAETGASEIVKSGVWAIEFITYNLVGKSTLCSTKYFIQVDITEYEFVLQYALGTDYEQTYINTDNFAVSSAIVDDEGNISSYTASENVEIDGMPANVLRLRRANKVLIRVEFKNNTTYNTYILTQFTVGNISFATGTYEYVSRKAELKYAYYEPEGKDKVGYTFEVDASYCKDENLRNMQFTFKELTDINVSNTTQTYDGTSKSVTTSVPKIQSSGGGMANVVTKYYTTSTYEDEYLVEVGENKSNIPVDAGTYYYVAELPNHGQYYGKATGTLVINKYVPSLSTVAINNISYGDSMAKVDFAGDRDNMNNQIVSNGIYALFSDVGSDHFVPTMSSDKIPGYYELIVDDKTATSYTNPQAGKHQVKVKFTPVKGTESGYTVVFEYDADGNFIPDSNYEVVTTTLTLTVVHDDKVIFTVSQDQEGGLGSVEQTTMLTSTGTSSVNYVEYTYNGARRAISFEITSSYELDTTDSTKFLDLKNYVKISYAQVDSLTLSEKELDKLTYADVSPIDAGIYAVRIMLDESKCNYSKTIYTYIHIKKIKLRVEVSETVYDFQYENLPNITVKLNNVDYSGEVEGYIYDYFYYISGENVGIDQICAESNRVSEDDTRTYTGNPVSAGQYYVRVSIDDTNYEGIGYGLYVINKVSTDNIRYNATWPSVNGSQHNPQYQLTYGQPTMEINLGSSYSLTYPYVEYRASGATSTSQKSISGKIYVVSMTYEKWLETRTDGQSTDRITYIDDMQAYCPDYSISPYLWYLCFSAETTVDGVTTYDTNFDFIYTSTSIYVGQGEIDWENVVINDITYGDTVESINDENGGNTTVTVSKTLGLLYSTSGNIPAGATQDQYYIRNQKYVYTYVKSDLYYYELTNNKPSVSQATVVNFEIKANFANAGNNYVATYVGSKELVINKKELTITYNYNYGEENEQEKTTESKTYKAFTESEYYAKLEYDGFVGEQPTELIGAFSYTNNGNAVDFDDLQVGEYEVTYVLDNVNYCGTTTFILVITKSSLTIDEKPDVAGADKNIVYGNNVKKSVAFTVSSFTATGGESVSQGAFSVSSKIGVYTTDNDGNTVLEIQTITDETTFPSAGTKVRIYFDFSPTDTTNYSAFVGTNDNGGYVEVTVGKADVSSYMTLSTKQSEYTYKDVYNAKELPDGIDSQTVYDVIDYAISEGYDQLEWTLSVTNSLGLTPTANYLNAGNYVMTVAINDDNYQGSVSCDLIINKRNAYIELTNTEKSTLLDYGGLYGTKTPYNSSAQTIKYLVYEIANNGNGVQIDESATVVYSQSGQKLSSVPSDIGYYDVSISLSSSANYKLVEKYTQSDVSAINSFLIISVDLTVIEIINIDQVYTVQKTVSVFMGYNVAECTVTYEKDGKEYSDLPIEAGEYDIYLNFKAYENNGYEDKIKATEIKSSYVLKIAKYYTEITSPTNVTITYTGEPSAKFSPYTSPYGLTLNYSYRLNGTNEYTPSTITDLGALDAGVYDVKMEIDDNNYRGEKVIEFVVNKANVTEKTSPVFNAYEYNSSEGPSETGVGAFVMGTKSIEGTFSISVDSINTLPVGEHTVSYTFTPTSNNYNVASGTVKLTIEKRKLESGFITLGENGNLLLTQDYSEEYNGQKHSLVNNVDTSVIYGYPTQNGDFTVTLVYSIDGKQLSPQERGEYTVTAKISSKNYYADDIIWQYKFIITQGTPVISEIPQAVRDFALGATVTSDDFIGGKSIVNSAVKTQINGTFALKEENVVLTTANVNRLLMTFTPDDEGNFVKTELYVTVNVIGNDPISVDGTVLESGKTINGSDITGKTIAHTFVPKGIAISELSASESDHNHGVIVVCSAKNGTSTVDYGASLSALTLSFKCAQDGCEECQKELDYLNTYGALSFVDDGSYVPFVGEKIKVAYKIKVENVENGNQYNNISVLIENDVIVQKHLTSANSSFEYIVLSNDNGQVITVYDLVGKEIASYVEINGVVTLSGEFRNNEVLALEINNIVDGQVELTLKTTNYVIEQETVTVKNYQFVASEDIQVQNTSKTYDGTGLQASDLGISVSNSQIVIDSEAYAITVYQDGELSQGINVGAYVVMILVNDEKNGYYGTKEITFNVVKRDVSEEIYLGKGKETVDGQEVYYDSYASGSHTRFTVYLDGKELPTSEYTVEIKYAVLGDSAYSTVGSLSVGEYTVKITVNATDYRGTRTFNYRVDPQKIIMTAPSISPVDYNSSAHLGFTFAPNFTDESGKNFSFEEKGGYTVWYYSTSYPKSSILPSNAGRYTIIVESNNENYNIVSNTATLVINALTVRVATAPTPIAIDADGNHLIYGQALSLLRLSTVDAVVTNSQGESVDGKYSIPQDQMDRVLSAGQATVSVLFTPTDKNYAECTINVNIKIGQKTIRVIFTNLYAYYNGTSRKNLIAYEEIQDQVSIGFTFTNTSGQTVDPVDAGVYGIKASVADNNYKVVLTSGDDTTSPVFTVRKALVNEGKVVIPVASSVGVGETLNKSSLSGGKVYYEGFSEPIKGSFSYVEGGRTYSLAGDKTVEFIFNPDDSVNFSSYRGYTTIYVGKGFATLTGGTNTVVYGNKADFSSLVFTTKPADLDDYLKFDFTYGGVTYKDGDIIPAGTYYFTAWIETENYYSEKTLFSYVVTKKEIDVDFVDVDGRVVTTYSTTYGIEAFRDIKLYNANYSGKNTYLLKDESTIRSNIEYRYVSRAGTADYDDYVAPSAIGAYDLTVTVRHDNYTATKTVIYRVETGKINEIKFDEDTLLNQTYGSVTAPIILTSPSNVSYYVIYHGYNTTLPTAVGSYTITVYIDDSNYESYQQSAVFKINPKKISVTDVRVEDKAYDGVPTLSISASLSGVHYGDEVKLNITAETFNQATNVGEHYVTITQCYLSGLHASNYTLTYPTYDGRVKIYNNKIQATQGSSYILSSTGFVDGTSVTVEEINTVRNQTSIWSKMIGVQATVLSYSITVNNSETINTNQYKICIAIPEEYKDKDFEVSFDGALSGQTVSYTREGNYITFYASTASGEIVFESAEFKYGYVVTAAILIIILIAVVVVLILNPLQHRRQVSDKNAPKNAIKKIKKDR